MGAYPRPALDRSEAVRMMNSVFSLKVRIDLKGAGAPA
jgi:hypothetical protein